LVNPLPQVDTDWARFDARLLAIERDAEVMRRLLAD